MDHSKMSHESMDHDQKTKRQIEIMTSKFLRPTLMALAVSTSPAFFMAQAAEEMDPSMAMPSSGTQSINALQTSQSERCRDGSPKMDHGSMGAMGIMDHSKMSMDNGQMDGMESMDGGRLPQAELRSPYLPMLTAAAFQMSWSWRARKNQLFILLDKFEYQDADNGSALAWDAKGGSAVTLTAVVAFGRRTYQWRNRKR
jgi:copper resistance protein B